MTLAESLLIADVDLALGEPGAPRLNGERGAWVLFRWKGVPLRDATLRADAHGQIGAEEWAQQLEWCAGFIRLQRLRAAILQGRNAELGEGGGERPSLCVAVCTRDRPVDLERCLLSLERLPYSGRLEVIVVDNAPATDATELLVRRFPGFRYLREPRPGLDWARNRAIVSTNCEVVAFTDDDCEADSHWAESIGALFGADPGIGCLTGLVVPARLDTEGQQLFEAYGGFNRGFFRRWFRHDPSSDRRIARRFAGSGQFGTGANMAFRRSMFESIGLFDPALDVGTATQGAGDLEMFFRVLKTGHTLVYDPAAVIRHHHRRSTDELHRQIATWGSAMFAYIIRSWKAWPDERRGLLWVSAWMAQHFATRLFRSLVQPAPFPTSLVAGEIASAFEAPARWARAQREAEAIARTFGTIEFERPVPADDGQSQGPAPFDVEDGVVRIELLNPTPWPRFRSQLPCVQLFAFAGGTPVVQCTIETSHKAVSAAEVADAIALNVAWRPEGESLLRKLSAEPDEQAQELAVDVLPPLDASVGVSICIATLDRPHDLATCLERLTAATRLRPTEIIVVDNNPSSGLTPPVVARFPDVRLVAEGRTGVSWARNAGIAACSHPVVLITDDDTVPEDDWIERLIAPLADDRVQVVTGNVLPLEFATDAQRLFETYGGLGRGFVRRRWDGVFLRLSRLVAPPTWEMGGTANQAMRASWLRNPAIGPLDEALGPGTPTGVGEDTYFFYRTLAAGGHIVYEPGAVVWHRHRRTLAALARQLRSYSSGHVAYHLTTFLRHRDLRGLLPLVRDLPRYHWLVVKWRIRNHRRWPWRLQLAEFIGNLSGPCLLARSLLRARRLGRSPAFPALSGDAARTLMALPAVAPTVSVVIPAHNSAATIGAALDSLVGQNLREWEAVVVDDHSTDETRAVVLARAIKDRRIRLVRTINRGASAARNTGLSLARAPLVHFLDADDSITPDLLSSAVESLARDPSAVAWTCGWRRVNDAGESVETQQPFFGGDPFLSAARACPVTIHSIVNRTALLRRLGGFDESLVTCEDWDLWVRLTRSGGRILGNPLPLAVYRTHPTSLSGRAMSLLNDGLTVLARAHSKENRGPLEGYADRHARGAPATALAGRRAAWALWVAAQRVGGGPALNEAEVVMRSSGSLEPAVAAEMIVSGLAIAHSTVTATELPWREQQDSARLLSLVEPADADETWRLRALRRVEAGLLRNRDGARDLSLGARRNISAEAAFRDLVFDPTVMLAVVGVSYGGRSLGTVTLPVFNGVVNADAIAAALARRMHWGIVTTWLEATVLGDLTWRPSEDPLYGEGCGDWLRGDSVVARDLISDRSLVLARAGWLLLLQEFWGDPSGSLDDFYGAGAAPAQLSAEATAEQPAVIDLSRSLEWRAAPRDGLLLTPAIGSWIGWAVHVPAGADGRVSPRAQRAAFNWSIGPHLSRVVAREALLQRAIGSGSLRDRLRATFSQGANTAAAVDPQSTSTADGDADLPYDRHHFESLFARGRDPWSYDSPYEARKYQQTLALALAHSPRNALEVGCAEGHFTARLAPHVASLVAADISEIALERARDRLRAFGHLRYRQLDLGSDPIEGRFDLIVCSEVLYYMGDTDRLSTVGCKLLAALRPGGRLVCAHAHLLVDDPTAPGFNWAMTYGAKTIAESFARIPGARHLVDARSPHYRISVFGRAEDFAESSGPVIEIIESAQPEPAVVAHFSAGGGRAPTVAQLRTTRIPVLMYHRVATDGPAALDRWKIDPAIFERQMRWLRESGFRTVTAGDWESALSRGEGLPGRCVALTFDDGYEDFATVAWPVLRTLGFTATCFLVADNIGTTADWDDAAWCGQAPRLMDAATITRLAGEGASFGSHGGRHLRATAVDPRRLLDDCRSSREKISALLRSNVTTIAWPYGDADEAVREVAAMSGYTAGFGCREDFATLGDDPFDVPRLEIRGDMSEAEFVDLLRR
ncbi:MAG: glycosyltransferase [Gemmatimonadota bacterium]